MACNDDEFDLFELFNVVWAQRWVIFVSTAISVICSAVYVSLVKHQYESRTVLAPPSITVFATFVRDVRFGVGSESDVIGGSLGLSNSAMELLGRNLGSRAVQESFLREFVQFSDVEFGVALGEKKVGCVVAASFGPDRVSCLVVSAVGGDREKVLSALNGYIDYASSMTAKELQAFLLGIGTQHEISPEDLYRVELPPVSPQAPIRPQKTLILALGFIVGGVAGIFIVLLRSMFARRCSAG